MLIIYINKKWEEIEQIFDQQEAEDIEEEKNFPKRKLMIVKLKLMKKISINKIYGNIEKPKKKRLNKNKSKKKKNNNIIQKKLAKKQEKEKQLISKIRKKYQRCVEKSSNNIIRSEGFKTRFKRKRISS